MHIFVLQGDVTPFQRRVIAKWMLKKAEQLNLGMAINDDSGFELSWEEVFEEWPQFIAYIVNALPACQTSVFAFGVMKNDLRMDRHWPGPSKLQTSMLQT